MQPSKLLSVIELMGPPRSGKTTLALLLAKFLSERQDNSILVIDASLDQQTTKTLLQKPPQNTMTQLAQDILNTGYAHPRQAETRQALDFAFSNLPTPTPSNADLITVGFLSENLPATLQEMLRYGLTRLMAQHDFVVVDSYHPLIHQILPEEVLNILVICDANEQTPLPPGFKSLKTPGLIVTTDPHAQSTLGDKLEQLLTDGDLTMVGKLPLFNSEETMHQDLPKLFQDCLLRLNLPLSYA